MAGPTRSPSSCRARRLLLVPVALISLALVGCGQTANDTKSATAGLPDLEQSLLAHQWLLDPGDSTAGRAGAGPVTLVFASGDAAAGTAPCNTYRTQVTLEGDDEVRFAAPVAALEECEPPVMDSEADYFRALTAVRDADVTDRTRLVLAADGVRLSFTAFDIGAEITGEWSIVAVRTDQGTEPAVAGTAPTATFGSDRSLVVATGCNSLHTRWTIDRDQITFEPASQTLMGCEEPAGITDQEAALADALLDRATVVLTPTTLTLRDDTGAIVLAATRP